MSSPLISVITPTFNSAATLEKALKSVAGQKFRELEHLIIDNLSEDDTARIAESYRLKYGQVRLIREKDDGIYDAMNKGIRLSRGKWIYFLGSDDELYDENVLFELFSEGFFSLQRIVYGNVLVNGDVSWARDKTVYDGPFDLAKLLQKNICQQAIFYPRKVVRETGYFETKYRITADWDYNLRCYSKSEFVYTGRIIAVFNAGGLTTETLPDPHDTDLPANVIQYFSLKPDDPGLRDSHSPFYGILSRYHGNDWNARNEELNRLRQELALKEKRLLEQQAEADTQASTLEEARNKISAYERELLLRQDRITETEQRSAGLEELARRQDQLLKEKDVLLAEKEKIISEITALLTEKDRIISKHAALIASQEQLIREQAGSAEHDRALIREQQALIRSQDGLMNEQSRLSVEKDERIEMLKQMNLNLELQVRTHSRSAAEKESLLAEGAARAASLERMLDELRQRNTDLSDALSAGNRIIGEKENQVSSIYGSFSWKITKPLRKVHASLLNLYKAAANPLPAVFRIFYFFFPYGSRSWSLVKKATTAFSGTREKWPPEITPDDPYFPESIRDFFLPGDKAGAGKYLLILTDGFPGSLIKVSSFDAAGLFSLLAARGIRAACLGTRFYPDKEGEPSGIPEGIACLIGKYFEENWPRWLVRNGIHFSYVLFTGREAAGKYRDYVRAFTKAGMFLLEPGDPLNGSGILIEDGIEIIRETEQLAGILAGKANPLNERDSAETINAGEKKDELRILAFYLPQYHPIPENDAWWGKGFTEWTNVTRARPLFGGHVQPNLPSELGFYDLRVPEVREQQASLAREYGIDGFCYWHYWFGIGKQLLERPFREVLESGRPDFPFCIAWANQSWTGIWHGLQDQVLIEQTYPGRDDYIAHFNHLLPAFRDPRYIRAGNKPLFVVYTPDLLPDPAYFTGLWNELARSNGLEGIHFVGIHQLYWDHRKDGFDEKTIHQPGQFAEILEKAGLIANPVQAGLEPDEGPRVIDYNLLVQNYDFMKQEHHDFLPVVMPNWDNTPRSGKAGWVYQGSTPGLFGKHLGNAIKFVRSKTGGSQIVFIKSWNEWAEGNYLEPDLRWGRGYLEAVREAREKNPHQARSG